MAVVQSDTQWQDYEQTHPSENESGAGFQKEDNRETIELVWTCDEETKNI